MDEEREDLWDDLDEFRKNELDEDERAERIERNREHGSGRYCNCEDYPCCGHD